MNFKGQEEPRKEILNEIGIKKHHVESLQTSVKPVAPDNVIGRLTSMEAIGRKAISEASFNSGRMAFNLYASLAIVKWRSRC